MKKYQNIHTSIHTSSNKPYRYKVLSVVQETDKGEVGDSSSPRPTTFHRWKHCYNRVEACLGKYTNPTTNL